MRTANNRYVKMVFIIWVSILVFTWSAIVYMAWPVKPIKLVFPQAHEFIENYYDAIYPLIYQKYIWDTQE